MRCPACGETTELAKCPACGEPILAKSTHRAVRERDQVASDMDQTLADRDQTASDKDQTWTDHDQSSSDSDQRSANEDQEASDADYSAGGDADTHRRSAEARQQATRDRSAVSAEREETSRERLGVADARDRVADLRDESAADRDALTLLEDLVNDPEATRHDILERAKLDRARAAADRMAAAEDRARAAADREAAARDRAESIINHAESVDNLRLSTLDELTGTQARKFGLEQMERELERAHRTGASLVVAFVDVDGLKQVNDTAGHLAGDALLKLVGETLRSNVRPYDVLVRYGGDEFVCAMPNISLLEARARFDKIAAGLAELNPEHSIAFGLAEKAPGQELIDVLTAADADLLTRRATGDR